jgi:hypothetical protein
MEVRPSGQDLQEDWPNNLMLLYPKGCGGERFRKRQRYYCHVRLGKSNESELYDEASKSEVISKRVCIAGP